MCLNFLIFSPLEQFEISSFNTPLNYISTFPIELFENIFFTNYDYKNIYSFFDLIFLVSLIFIIQTNLNQKGYIFLYLITFAILSQINIYNFNDILINKLNIQEDRCRHIFIYSNTYKNFFSNNYEYITTLTSYINVYSVVFCFIFTYLIIYLIYNKMLSNNSNTLIPNIYQMVGENLYKISLNLFYSILGKHISIPEFFIKINTIFIFLILSNIQGMIPYLSTLTSALTNTFFIALALFISIIKTLLEKKGVNYFLNLFMPSGCPILLSLLIIPIELISYSFRLVSLSVRLFANMMAGHTLLKVIVGFSWIIVFSGSASFINIFPIIILFILTLLEFGVALIQAYIFTVLSCIYLRDIFEGH